MDWGLIGGLAEGVKSGIASYQTERGYQNKKKQDADELAIKQRMARAQEIDSAAKLADATGNIPEGLFGADVDKAFHPAQQQGAPTAAANNMSNLVSQPVDTSALGGQGGLINKPPGLMPQSQSSQPQQFDGSDYLTSPIATQFRSKADRDGIKEATEASRAAYGKGVAYKWNPQTKTVVPFQVPRGDEQQLDLEKKREELRKVQEDAGNVTQEKGQAALFGKRMQDAEQVFSGLEQSGYNRGTVGQGMEAYLPGALQGTQIRQQDQAERNFVNAVLRRESGAAIAQSEFDNAEKQYFPRAGDPPEVLAQKRQNRQLAINSMQQQAGKKAWGGLVSPSIGKGKKVSQSQHSAGDIVNVKGTNYRVGSDGDTLEPVQ